MRSLCVIPARGGSKRIHRKNIREFCGKPIIAYSIETALQSNCFDTVIVSTDDEEIARIAQEYGATVPFMRPESLSDDRTGTMPVVAHAIKELAKKQDKYELACCIYATAPFIRQQDLKYGQNCVADKWQFAFPVAEYAYTIYRSLEKLSDGSIQMVYPQHFFSRSQDLKPVFHDAGQFYWGTVKAWLEEEILFGNYSTPIVIPRRYVQDIDTEEDWYIAESMYQVNRREETKK